MKKNTVTFWNYNLGNDNVVSNGSTKIKRKNQFFFQTRVIKDYTTIRVHHFNTFIYNIQNKDFK